MVRVRQYARPSFVKGDIVPELSSFVEQAEEEHVQRIAIVAALHQAFLKGGWSKRCRFPWLESGAGEGGDGSGGQRSTGFPKYFRHTVYESMECPNTGHACAAS